MAGAGGTKDPRASLVDAGWDVDNTIDDVTVTDAEPIDVANARSTIDLDEHEVQTVSMPAHALRQLTAQGPPSGDNRFTQPDARRNGLDLGRDSAVDDLLDSEEGRRLASTAPPAHPAPSARSPKPLPPPPAPAVPTAPRSPAEPLASSQSARAPAPLPSFEPTAPAATFGGAAAGPAGPPAAGPAPAVAPAEASPAAEPTYVPPRNPPPRLVGAGDDVKTHPGVRQGSIRPRKAGSAGSIVMILGVTVPLAVGAGIWIGKSLFSTSAPIAAKSASLPAPPAPSATEAEPKPQTPIEKARAGDFDAIEALEQKDPSDRSAEETLAIAEGRSKNKHLALLGFKKKIEEDPSVLHDHDQLLRLRDFIEDRETTNEAAAIAAGLEDPLGPDLLYDVWVGVKERNETTELAEQLVYSSTVRKHASPALAVALDLRETDDCEQLTEILPRAHEQGDRRSLHLLGKLLKKHGCGPDKRDDCYACLRPLEDDDDAISIVDAIREVRTRPAPRMN